MIIKYVKLLLVVIHCNATDSPVVQILALFYMMLTCPLYKLHFHVMWHDWLKHILCVRCQLYCVILKSNSTFSTSGHLAVFPAYPGAAGVAPRPVTLSTRIAAVVLSVPQLRDDVHRQPVRMRILTGRRTGLKCMSFMHQSWDFLN